MPLKTTYVVQTFELKRKRLVQGSKEVAPTESGALKKAQAVAGRIDESFGAIDRLLAEANPWDIRKHYRSLMRAPVSSRRCADRSRP